MICIPPQAILARAKQTPAAYLQECQAASTIRAADQFWCFTPQDFIRIRKKYRGYASSVTNEIPDGPISGCCDRADQA